MKSRTLLTQALKLKEKATFSQVKKLVEVAREYQKENDELFLKAEARKEVKLLDGEGFFRFLSEVSKVRVKSFEDIKNYLNAQSRAENIIFSSNSKSKNIHPFFQTLLIKKRGELPKLYKKDDLKTLCVKKITAVENGESFLNLDEEMFDSDFFIYLGGNASTMVREFLKTLEVEFFIDLDIYENRRIFSSYTETVNYLKFNGYNEKEKFVLYLDEFHTVEGIGKILKNLYDHHPNIKIFATGSSSLEIVKHLKGVAVEFRVMGGGNPETELKIKKLATKRLYAQKVRF